MRSRKPELIDLQLVEQPRGRLAIAEGAALPFTPARFFIGYDIPRSATRGAHAHRRFEQLLVAVAGAVTIETQCAEGNRNFFLRHPGVAVYVPPMVWATQRFSSRAARLLVLASAPYDEAEYIRDYAEFLRAIGRK